MRLHLETVALIGSLSIKLTKDETDAEIVVASLPFKDAVLPRETASQLARMPASWLGTAFYDHNGAARLRCRLALHPKIAYHVAGSIRVGDEPGTGLVLANAAIAKLALDIGEPLTPHLSGVLAWKVAGDEASDAEGLIGRLAGCRWDVFDDKPADLFDGPTGSAVLDTPPAGMNGPGGYVLPAGNEAPREQDSRYAEAVAYVRTVPGVTPGGLQGALGVGYNRACALLERLEREGLLGPIDVRSGVRPVVKQTTEVAA